MLSAVNTYEIHEDGMRFATIEARTAQAALFKAAKQYKRRAADYNGYVGAVEWSAFAPGEPHSSASITVLVK